MLYEATFLTLYLHYRVCTNMLTTTIEPVVTVVNPPTIIGVRISSNMIFSSLLSSATLRLTSSQRRKSAGNPNNAVNATGIPLFKFHFNNLELIMQPTIIPIDPTTMMVTTSGI